MTWIIVLGAFPCVLAWCFRVDYPRALAESQSELDKIPVPPEPLPRATARIRP